MKLTNKETTQELSSCQALHTEQPQTDIDFDRAIEEIDELVNAYEREKVHRRRAQLEAELEAIERSFHS